MIGYGIQWNFRANRKCFLSEVGRMEEQEFRVEIRATLLPCQVTSTTLTNEIIKSHGISNQNSHSQILNEHSLTFWEKNQVHIWRVNTLICSIHPLLSFLCAWKRRGYECNALNPSQAPTPSSLHFLWNSCWVLKPALLSRLPLLLEHLFTPHFYPLAKPLWI